MEDRGALLDAVRGTGAYSAGAPGAASRPEPYQFLLSRETRVLETVDRVVNDTRRAEARERAFLDTPLHEVGMRAMSALKGLMDDLLAARSVRDVRAAFLAHGERRLYLGVLMLALGALIAAGGAL